MSLSAAAPLAEKAACPVCGRTLGRILRPPATGLVTLVSRRIGRVITSPLVLGQSISCEGEGPDTPCSGVWRSDEALSSQNADMPK